MACGYLVVSTIEQAHLNRRLSGGCHNITRKMVGKHMNIKVLSGSQWFLVELDTCYMLFDYYKGNLNNISKDKN